MNPHYTLLPESELCCSDAGNIVGPQMFQAVRFDHSSSSLCIILILESFTRNIRRETMCPSVSSLVVIPSVRSSCSTFEGCLHARISVEITNRWIRRMPMIMHISKKKRTVSRFGSLLTRFASFFVISSRFLVSRVNLYIVYSWRRLSWIWPISRTETSVMFCKVLSTILSFLGFDGYIDARMRSICCLTMMATELWSFGHEPFTFD